MCKRPRYPFHTKKHQEKVAQLLECQAAGLSRSQAAGAINMSRTWVRWAIQEYNINEAWGPTKAEHRQILLERLSASRAYILAVRNKVCSLPPHQQEIYRLYRRKKFSSIEAFAAIGESPP